MTIENKTGKSFYNMNEREIREAFPDGIILGDVYYSKVALIGLNSRISMEKDANKRRNEGRWYNRLKKYFFNKQ